MLRREGNRYTVHAASLNATAQACVNLTWPADAWCAWSQLAARIEDMGMGRKTLHGYRIVDEEERTSGSSGVRRCMTPIQNSSGHWCRSCAVTWTYAAAVTKP